MDLALNNLHRLICHKTQPTNQPTNQPKPNQTCALYFKASKLAVDKFLGKSLKRDLGNAVIFHFLPLPKLNKDFLLF